MSRFFRCLANASLCALTLMAATPGHGQESLVKGETLVRLQAIPLSKPMTFEQLHSDDEVEYLTLLTLQGLDFSKAWNSSSSGWNLYRVNMRADVESSLRQRAASSNGTLRTLSQNPETSLAQHYADTFSGPELDEALQFYQSATGKKFLAYQRALKQTYHRGKLVFEQMRVDPAVGQGKSPDELRALWLAKTKLPAESPTETYSFHVKTVQTLVFNNSSQDVAFNLAAGAVPGGEAMKRLDALLSAEERAQVSQYFASATAAKEMEAIKAWRAKIGKRAEILPLQLGEVGGVLNVMERWRKTRNEPDALPRSMAKIDPASIQIPDAIPTHRLDDSAVEQLKACLPGSSPDTLAQLQKIVQTKDYQRSSTTFSGNERQAFYTTRLDRAACVQTTQAGYPILGPESFVSTIAVVGMTDEQTTEWRKKLARAVAASGSARALVIAGGGNAFEVNFAVDARSPQRLVYTVRFRPIGTYDTGEFSIVEQVANFKSISTNASTGTDGVQRMVKSILSSADEIKRDEESRRSKN